VHAGHAGNAARLPYGTAVDERDVVHRAYFGASAAVSASVVETESAVIDAEFAEERIYRVSKEIRHRADFDIHCFGPAID